MYSWITHTHSHLSGECPHKCSYCYVKYSMANKFTKKYEGKMRIIEKELDVDYGAGKTIFIEHMSDLFAYGIPDKWITDILCHCEQYPDNKYVFQTRNTLRAYYYWQMGVFPLRFYIGTTIESNREYKDTNAPKIENRIAGLKKFVEVIPGFGMPIIPSFPVQTGHGFEKYIMTYITIEPIMDFDLAPFLKMLVAAKPNFINIGADSKGNKLPEPSKEKIMALIDGLKQCGIEIKQKSNLARLMK